MLIELKWLDGNSTKKYKTEIYKSSVAFNDLVEAELIATVNPGIGVYADTDVVQGQKYYYRFRNVQGSAVSPASKLFEFEANQYTGPGPQRIVFGDEHFGYYGMFPSDPATVPTLNRLRAVFGLSDLSEERNTTPLHKFAVGGRVRGIHAAPLASGDEIASSNPLLKQLIDGGFLQITLGLHTWVIILPSTVHAQNTEHPIEHFPGELRSMLGVVTEMYSRVEDAVTGNTTGNRLIPTTGQVPFYSTIADMFNPEISWIASSDWVGDTSTVINWTSPTGPAPLRPKELHIEDVDYSTPDNWYKTLIWPVIIYTGLIGPT